MVSAAERRRADARPGGFTLLEILIAVILLAFVFTTLFVSYRQLVGDAQALSRRNALNEMAAMAMHHIVSDLERVFVLQPPFYRPPEMMADELPPYRFTGTTASLGGESFSEIRFVSGRHIDLRGSGDSGLAAIRYYAEDDGDGRMTLKRRDRLVFAEAAPSDAPLPDPTVCTHLAGFEVTFIDADGDTYDAWDSEAESFKYATPTAVTIQLDVESPTGEAVHLATTVVLASVRKEAGAIE